MAIDQLNGIGADDLPEGSLSANSSSLDADFDKEAHERWLLHLYVTQAREFPILTHEEIVPLFMQVEDGKLAKAELNGFKGSESKKKVLEERVLMAELAVDHIIRSNMRLVISIARKFSSPRVPILDRIQDGNTGLIAATYKYNYRKGNHFSTYATHYIRRAILNGINDTGRTVRIPSSTQRMKRTVDRFVYSYLSEHGHEPSDEEVASFVGLRTTRNIPFYRSSPVFEDPISLDMQSFRDTLDPLIDYLSDPRSLEGYQIVDGEEHRDFFDEFLKNIKSDPNIYISDRQYFVISLRYGLEGQPALSYEEIAEKIGVTSERVRKIESAVFKKLRSTKFESALRGYLRSFNQKDFRSIPTF